MNKRDNNTASEQYVYIKQYQLISANVSMIFKDTECNYCSNIVGTDKIVSLKLCMLVITQWWPIHSNLCTDLTEDQGKDNDMNIYYQNHAMVQFNVIEIKCNVKESLPTIKAKHQNHKNDFWTTNLSPPTTHTAHVPVGAVSSS